MEKIRLSSTATISEVGITEFNAYEVNRIKQDNMKERQLSKSPTFALT